MTADVLEEPSVELVLPRDLDVRHQRWEGQDIGTRAPLLPRDADTLRVGIGDFRNLHRKSLSRRADDGLATGEIEFRLRRLKQLDLTTLPTMGPCRGTPRGPLYAATCREIDGC
jgi:hypothetical protein